MAEHCAGISRERQKYLEIIVQCDNIAMRLGYLLESENLVHDLREVGLGVCAGADRSKR